MHKSRSGSLGFIWKSKVTTLPLYQCWEKSKKETTWQWHVCLNCALNFTIHICEHSYAPLHNSSNPFLMFKSMYVIHLLCLYIAREFPHNYHCFLWLQIHSCKTASDGCVHRMLLIQIEVLWLCCSCGVMSLV
jgi:hypothetical protein